MKLLIPMVVTTQFTITMQLVDGDKTIAKYATNMQQLENDVQNIVVAHPALKNIEIITKNRTFAERYTKKLGKLSKYSKGLNVNIIELKGE